jgi:hypothetical protein
LSPHCWRISLSQTYLRRMLYLLCIATASMCISPSIFAHKASDSYLTLERHDATAPDTPQRISGRWDIALRDLDIAIGIDENADGVADGVLQWQEIKAKHTAIASYALSRLTVSNGNAVCALTVGTQQIERHTDGAYSVLPIEGMCEGAEAATLTVDYRLLFDLDAQHRGLLKLTDHGRTVSALLSADQPTQRFAPRAAKARTALSTFLDFVADGIKHIAIGFDHILFLVALLLPAVLKRETGMWLPVAAMGKALWAVASIVTAFTVAHSITLSLATLGILAPPSRLVEALIAVTVMLTAIDNIVPIFPDALQNRRWLVAFAFGLIHGFGFANVLQELSLPQDALMISLVGFNVGVELGQLMIVGIVLPIIYTLRNQPAYPRWVLKGGSYAIGTVAIGWLLERTLRLEFMPF